MYEYKVEEFQTLEWCEKIMNQYAAEGWRVVSTLYRGKPKETIVITFEREK